MPLLWLNHARLGVRVCGVCRRLCTVQWHIDLWIGNDDVSPGGGLIACEVALSDESWSDAATVEVDAPNGHVVDVTPLFDTPTNTCIIPSTPCQDDGNVCGNKCELPDPYTCAELEKMLYLTPKRFLELNPDLDCSNVVTANTPVCMGGTCGDVVPV